MLSFSAILGALTSLLGFVPLGGPFRPFLETLVQIVTFAMQFQPPA